MELRVYIDVYGWETEQKHFYPFTGRRLKHKDATRYCFVVEVPDENKPDHVIGHVELKQDG